MKKQAKILSASAAFLALTACSSIDTGLGEDLTQRGEVNQGEDINTGYILEDGQVYLVNSDGSRVAVSDEDLLKIDANGDGIPDFDKDQDGVVDIKEEVIDTDGDGIPNDIDTDIDGDGIDNADDTDIDGDGIDNIDDNDIDGDGIENTSDNDIDGDGINNDVDNDIDGDGIANSEDNDVDGDGILNGEDPDVDGDGILNGDDPDVDGDGVDNGSDDDVDGDGISNDNDSDVDGDGIPNENDPDIDGDGIPNEDDTNDDVDGSLTGYATHAQSIEVEILQTSTTSNPEVDVIVVQDIRDEIAKEDIELATVQISNFYVTISNADALISDMGSTEATVTATVEGQTLFTSAPGTTIAEVAAGVSVTSGDLIINAGVLQSVENEIKDLNGQPQLSITVQVNLDTPAESTYIFNVDFEVEANGKKEI